MEEKKIKPIVLTDTETNDVYTLEFTRDTVKYTEFKGFNIDDIDKKPMSAIPELFYYAFRAHHRNISREKTDKILFEDLGGMSTEMLERLGELYAVPLTTLFAKENTSKNSKMTVEL